MRNANEFYDECFDGFVAVAQGFGYANGGKRGNEVLMKRAEQSIRELLKVRVLIKMFGKDPTMYYYYINGFAFAMGVVLAMLQANAPQKFADRNLIPMIVNDPETSPHDLAFHTLQQFGMHPEIYNQLVQEIYKRFQELHAPYWETKEPRDYTLAAFTAAFMTGCSISIGKFEEKRAQQQTAPVAPVEKKAVSAKKPPAEKTAAKKPAARKSVAKKPVSKPA